jgi:hypothetical protein
LRICRLVEKDTLGNLRERKVVFKKQTNKEKDNEFMKRVPSQEVCRCDGTKKLRVHNRESVSDVAVLSLALPTNTQGVKRSLQVKQRRKAIFIVRWEEKKLPFRTQH